MSVNSHCLLVAILIDCMPRCTVPRALCNACECERTGSSRKIQCLQVWLCQHFNAMCAVVSVPAFHQLCNECKCERTGRSRKMQCLQVRLFRHFTHSMCASVSVPAVHALCNASECERAGSSRTMQCVRVLLAASCPNDFIQVSFPVRHRTGRQTN